MGLEQFGLCRTFRRWGNEWCRIGGPRIRFCYAERIQLKSSTHMVRITYNRSVNGHVVTEERRRLAG